MRAYTNCVYRFLNIRDEVIYVGKAKDLEKRISGHTHLPDSCYEELVIIQYIEFTTEYDMDFAERYFIQKYCPKYNSNLSDKKLTLTLKELDVKLWFEYKVSKDVIRSQLEQIKQLPMSINIKFTLEEFILLYATSINSVLIYDCYSKSNTSPLVQRLNRLQDEFYKEIYQKAMERLNKYPLFDIGISFAQEMLEDSTEFYRNGVKVQKNFEEPTIKGLNRHINLVSQTAYMKILIYLKYNTCSRMYCDDCISAKNKDTCEKDKLRFSRVLELRCKAVSV